MKDIQLVVFDMAGTTVNEDNLVYKTVQKAIERVGYPVPLETVLLIAAGKEKRTAITDVLATVAAPEKIPDLAARAFEDFKNLLSDAYRDSEVQPMAGAEEVFTQLQKKGIRVALNTGYSRQIANQLLSKLGWLDHPLIDVTVTASDVSRGRPHPDMIWLAMEKCGVSDAGQVVKTGDSIVDIEEGINAGCGIVAGITTGAQTEEQLKTAHPTYIIGSLLDLLALI